MCAAGEYRVAAREARDERAVAEAYVPAFHIEMFEGRSVEQKRQLAAALTGTTCKVLGVEPQSVDIVFHDVKPESWATAGKLWSDPR